MKLLEERRAVLAEQQQLAAPRSVDTILRDSISMHTAAAGSGRADCGSARGKVVDSENKQAETAETSAGSRKKQEEGGQSAEKEEGEASKSHPPGTLEQE